MKIVFFGSGERARVCLRKLIQEKYDVVEFAPSNPNLSKFINKIKSIEPDLIILCGYNKIVKKELIDIPKLGIINLHGGMLPRYRGTAPINWQIINGELLVGCCILYVEEGIDTGNILVEEFFLLQEDDTAQDVINQQLLLFPEMLIKAISRVKKGWKGEKQNDSAAHYYTRRYPEDSEILWDKMTGDQVHNLIRAMVGPYPRAFTFDIGFKLEINSSMSYNKKITGTPGRVIRFIDGYALVTCKEGAVLINNIGIDGTVKPAKLRLKIGDKLS